MKKAFTTIELVVAVAMLAIVMVISGSIFKITIEAKRRAGAISEITRNFRAITDQINRDFEGLVDDGYLVIRNEEPTGTYYPYNDDQDTVSPRIDKIIFFSTGDFQSTILPNNRSNIGLIYYGFEKPVLENNKEFCSDWALIRGIQMLLPEESAPTNPEEAGYNEKAFSDFKADVTTTETELLNIVNNNDYWDANVADPCNNWKYFADGVGDFKIQYPYLNDPIDANGVIDWRPEPTSLPGSPVWWRPTDNNWPRAIKFTMTLYDSEGIFPEGKTFTHIVYLDK